MTASWSERSTRRLLLRRPVDGDLDVLFAIHADPETNRFDPTWRMDGVEQAAAQLRGWQRHWREHGFGYWVVSEKADAAGAVIGFAGIRFATWQGRTVLNLAYRLTPSAWGNGYATEAAREAVELWRAKRAGHPLVAHMAPANVPSQRTAAAAGLARRPDLDQPEGAVGGPALAFALGWDYATESGSMAVPGAR